MTTHVVVPHHGAGAGRLVRQGRTVLFTTGDGPATAALVGWCRFVGDRSAADVLADLGRVVDAGPAVGPFVLVVLDDDGVEIAASGGLPLAVRTAAGVEVVAGEGLQRRSVPGVEGLWLVPDGSVADPLLELERGVVAASGFEVRISRPAAAGAWAPPPAAEAALAPQVVSLLTPDDELPPAEPLPVAVAPAPAPEPEPAPAPAPAPAPEPAPEPAPAAAVPDTPAPPAPGGSIVEPMEPADDEHVHVQGLRCSRDHFNDPRVRYCAVCGIAMHQASFILVEEMRPPLGVLTFSDGSHRSLARTVVLGRDPVDDPAVLRGEATAVPLADVTNTLSRVHAEIRLLGWDVLIVDRGSTNGTYVWDEARQAWDRLVPEQPRALVPGTHVAFGRQAATFESPLRQR